MRFKNDLGKVWKKKEVVERKIAKSVKNLNLARVPTETLRDTAPVAQIQAQKYLQHEVHYDVSV